MMRDQAEKLRILAQTLKQQVEEDIKKQAHIPPVRSNRGIIFGKNSNTRVIAVTSGKGGVGKTNFAVNMGLALAARGQRVMIMDADLGLANADVLLGVTPQYNLYHVLKGEKSIREIITYGPQGLMLIAGGSGIQEMANLPRKQIENFITGLGELEGMTDILIIDTGAGLNRNVLTFLLASDEVVVICTPEPTAITDAYGLVKSLYQRQPESHVHLVVNRVENAEEADITATKLTMVAERFLQFPIGRLGYILDDPSVTKAVKSQEPFLLKYPKSLAANCIHRLAGQLLEQGEEQQAPSGVKAFFAKVSKFFS
ncbi:MAG: MinD/ParA family protein [Thermincolia bacterium]